MCLVDINGHIGRQIDGLDGVHGGYGVGQRNLEGGMLLEFCLEKELCVSSTWLKRVEEADIDKRKMRKVVRKTCTERRKISLLDDV